MKLFTFRFISSIGILNSVLFGQMLAAAEENGEATVAQEEPQQAAESAETFPRAGVQALEGPNPNANPSASKTILINFTNVNIVEFIRFISKISNKNFVFDEGDLQFNVTIVSEEPTTIENIMSALLQELRIHGLTMFERGNNIIIHKNPGVNAISRVVGEGVSDVGGPGDQETEIVTRVFRLNATDPEKAALILRPLVSDKAVIDVFKETNNIIVTDIVTNIEQIGKLLKSVDAPNNGFVIGQYVVRQGFIDSLIQLAQQIMLPIANDQTLTFVAHPSINSIFIVSTPFLMERTLAILQYLDQTQGITRIFDLKDLKFTPEEPLLQLPVPGTGPTAPSGPSLGEDQWILDNQGGWMFRPKQPAGVPSGQQPPEGNWYVDEQGNWRFRVGGYPPGPGEAPGLAGPEGQWRLDSQGIWVFQLAPGKSISPERLERQTPVVELPIGHIERTQFSIYRLRYRRGDQVQAALGRIGYGLSSAGNINPDLLQTIYNVQWIEASNSLVITGTAQAIAKVQQLILEIDAPLRQVFIEMLILDTTIDNSLQFGVDWGTRFGGDNTAGAQGFIGNQSVLPTALNTTGIGLIPDASSLGVAKGFTQGIIGQRITHCGMQFDTIAALVTAIHNDTEDDIIMSPKILVEDNAQAEIFVGINTRYPTQALASNQGSIITQNFEYRDVGTRLKVSPQISENDIITLTIEEEVSSLAGGNSGTNINPSNVGPTTNQSRTTTRVHIPNKCFLILSGMMQDEDLLDLAQIPCLGGVPFLGGGFKQQTHTDKKRNLMIFIRPIIVDTEEEINAITSHEQKIWDYKKAQRTRWKQETDEALDFFNLPNGTECDECECIDY